MGGESGAAPFGPTRNSRRACSIVAFRVLRSPAAWALTARSSSSLISIVVRIWESILRDVSSHNKPRNVQHSADRRPTGANSRPCRSRRAMIRTAGPRRGVTDPSASETHGRDNGRRSEDRLRIGTAQLPCAAVLGNGGDRGVVRVLSSPDGGNGDDALALDPSSRSARAEVRVGHLRGGGQHPASHPHHGAKDPHARPSLTPAAHLTCVGASRAEVDEVARSYHAAGVRHIVALRGDPPEGGAGYAPHPGGYPHAVDLVAGLRHIADFDISVAAYPETTPRGSEPRVRPGQPQAEAGCGGEPGDHPVLLRHRAVPSFPRSGPPGRHRGPADPQASCR